MAPRIYLVRHAQSTWQLTRDKDLDSTLTPLGHSQSQALAAWLPHSFLLDNLDGRPVRLFASPMRRAQETSLYLSKTLDMKVEICEELREAPFRVADLLPAINDPFSGATYAPPPEYLAFRCQARKALGTLYGAAEEAQAPVLAVTHGGLIKTLLRVAVGSDRICFDIFNATVTVLDWQGGYWRLAHVSLWDHLNSTLKTR